MGVAHFLWPNEILIGTYLVNCLPCTLLHVEMPCPCLLPNALFFSCPFDVFACVSFGNVYLKTLIRFLTVQLRVFLLDTPHIKNNIIYACLKLKRYVVSGDNATKI